MNYYKMQVYLFLSLLFSVHHIPSTRTTDVIWRMFEGMIIPQYSLDVAHCSLGFDC